MTARAVAVFATAGWHPSVFYAERDRARACGLNTINGRTVSTSDILRQAEKGSIDGIDLLTYAGYNWDELIESCYSYAGETSCW
jgi:hypothetical protein